MIYLEFLIAIKILPLYNYKFPHRFTLKYIKLQLKFKKKKICNQKRTAHWYIVTSVLLKPLKQRLINVTQFRLGKSFYSRSVLFKCCNNFGPAFQIFWDVEFMRTYFLHMWACFFPFPILITLTFPSKITTFLAFEV